MKPLRRGKALFRHKGNTTAIVWMDQMSVYVILNVHLPTTTMVKRGNPHGSKSEVSCPTPVSESNRHMGEVDLLDRQNCYYSYNRKSKRWWLHHFLRPVYRQCLYRLQTCVSNILSSTNEFQAEGSAEVLNGDDRLVIKSLRKVTSSVVTSVFSMGHKIADLRPNGFSPGRCEY